MKEIHCDREILEIAIVDAINVFAREVLRPRGLLSEEYYRDEEVLRGKYEVAARVAETWEFSRRNDDPMDPADSDGS